MEPRLQNNQASVNLGSQSYPWKMTTQPPWSPTLTWVEGSCTTYRRPNPCINACPFKDKPYLNANKDLTDCPLAFLLSSKRACVYGSIHKFVKKRPIGICHVVPLQKMLFQSNGKLMLYFSKVCCEKRDPSKFILKISMKCHWQDSGAKVAS